MVVAVDLVGSQLFRVRDQSGANAALQLDVPVFQGKLVQVMVRYSSPVTLDVDVTLKSGAGAAYDSLIQRLSLQANLDAVFVPDGEIKIGSDDFVRVDAPAGGAGVVSKVSVYVESAS